MHKQDLEKWGKAMNPKWDATPSTTSVDHRIELFLRHARRQGRRPLTIDSDDISNEEDPRHREEASRVHL